MPHDTAPAHSDAPCAQPFTRRILLAVTGLSPQIVTETLFALATRQDGPFVPSEIHLITTREGAQRARLALLSEHPGWFHRLRKDYHLPPIHFTSDCIHIIHDATGQALEDIRSPEDNLACADFITEQVRALTADADTALHVSIAGGRKTMGFLLGYALSLFGRPQDRLSHVIVSEPFESSWEFFYPTPYSQVIETRERTLADTCDAHVSLAEIPFVSLRHGLPQALLQGRASYRGTVEAARAGVAPASLEITLSSREVRTHGKHFTLPPSELALLCVFARRAMHRLPPLTAPAKGVLRFRLGTASAGRTAQHRRPDGRPVENRTGTAPGHGRRIFFIAAVETAPLIAQASRPHHLHPADRRRRRPSAHLPHEHRRRQDRHPDPK